MTTPNPITRPCACASYSVLIKVSESTAESIWQQKTTECRDTTQSTYAQGHDAKLKKFLVWAGIEGHPVRRTQGEVVIGRDALRWAAELNWADDVRERVEKGKSGA
ncbi:MULTISPECIES: hypothetical protein [Streptomyces]|uniref:Integrase n=1 Tax=Streptomyces sp. CMC78 TaxID=3231512 RepID=A0AB33KCS3_9ACTN